MYPSGCSPSKQHVAAYLKVSKLGFSQHRPDVRYSFTVINASDSSKSMCRGESSFCHDATSNFSALLFGP